VILVRYFVCPRSNQRFRSLLSVNRYLSAPASTRSHMRDKKFQSQDATHLIEPITNGIAPERRPGPAVQRVRLVARCRACGADANGKYSECRTPGAPGHVRRASCAPATRSKCWKEFAVGDRVSTNYNGTWFPGVVVSVQESSYEVMTDDDGAICKYPSRKVRKVVPQEPQTVQTAHQVQQQAHAPDAPSQQQQEAAAEAKNFRITGIGNPAQTASSSGIGLEVLDEVGKTKNVLRLEKKQVPDGASEVAEHDAIQSKSVKKRNAETGAEISRPKKKQKRRRVPYAENADVDDPNAKSSSADNNEASEVPDATNDSSCWHLAEGQVGSDCQGNEVGLGISDEMMVTFIDADDDEDPDCMDI
jgi:hypothetical protein